MNKSEIAEREKFEKFIQGRFRSIEKHLGSTKYRWTDVQLAWEAWERAIAESQARPFSDETIAEHVTTEILLKLPCHHLWKRVTHAFRQVIHSKIMEGLKLPRLGDGEPSRRQTAREWMLQTGEHATELHSLVGEEVYAQILADMDEFAESGAAQEVSPPSPEIVVQKIPPFVLSDDCESNSVTLGAYCKHGNSYCLLCFAESKSHPTRQPVKKFEEQSRDLGNSESAESGAKTDPEPKGTCSKHVGLHINIEELCEEWHEEREFDAYCKAVGFWPTDENFKIWKESPLRGFANSGPLCDNCSKTSREHYCYFGSSYDEKFSPSERRSSPFSDLQIAIDTATKPLHAEIEKLRGDTRELKAALKEDCDWPKQYVVPCPGCKRGMSYLPSEGFAWRCANKKCRFSSKEELAELKLTHEFAELHITELEKEQAAKKPLTKAFLVCNSGFPQYIFLQRDDAECCADREFGDSPEVEIKAVELREIAV